MLLPSSSTGPSTEIEPGPEIVPTTSSSVPVYEIEPAIWSALVVLRPPAGPLTMAPLPKFTVPTSKTPAPKSINCPVLVALLPLTVPPMIRAPPLVNEMLPVPEIEAPGTMSNSAKPPSIASSVGCAPDIV